MILILQSVIPLISVENFQTSQSFIFYLQLVVADVGYVGEDQEYSHQPGQGEEEGGGGAGGGREQQLPIPDQVCHEHAQY